MWYKSLINDIKQYIKLNIIYIFQKYYLFIFILITSCLIHFFIFIVIKVKLLLPQLNNSSTSEIILLIPDNIQNSSIEDLKPIDNLKQTNTNQNNFNAKTDNNISIKNTKIKKQLNNKIINNVKVNNNNLNKKSKTIKPINHNLLYINNSKNKLNNKITNNNLSNSVVKIQNKIINNDLTVHNKQLNASQLLASSNEIISKLNSFTKLNTANLKIKYINHNTKDYKYNAYIEAWRIKIEKIGNLNYPIDSTKHSLYGSLVLDVALNADGNVKEINIVRSSGNKVLDEHAIKIIKIAAPFAKFPHEIQKETDVLHITRTWQFRDGRIIQ